MLKKEIKDIKNFISNNCSHINYIQQYNLQKSYSDKMLIEVSTGGSSGGNCYGDSTSSYRNETDEIISEIVSHISYQLKDLQPYISGNIDSIAKDFVKQNGSGDNEIAERDSYSDPYGNYGSYNLYEIDISLLMKKALKPEYLKDFEQALEDHVKGNDISFNDLKIKKEIIDLEKKIKGFFNESAKEKKKLQSNLNYLEKSTSSVQKQIASFDSKKQKELDSLEKRLEEIKPKKSSPKMKR